MLRSAYMLLQKSYIVMCVAMFVLVSGCYNVRFAAIVEEPNVGPNVITTHKYKLEEYFFSRKGSWVRGKHEKLKTDFERFYPGVFSDKGMPFVLYNGASFDTKTKYDATGLLYVFSAGILPYCQHTECREKYLVMLKSKGKVEKAAFTNKFLRSSALTCYTPIALACFKDPPDAYAAANQRYFWNTIAYGSDDDRFKINHQAIAYGVAIKLRELEQSGKVSSLMAEDNTKNVVNPTSSTDRSDAHFQTNIQSAASYEIVSCERESDSNFAYRFVLELTGKDKSLYAFRAVQKEFRQAVKEDYVESFPGVNKDSLFVEFPEYKLNNGKIAGRAVVLSISVTSFSYDPNTRTGKLAVKVNANQYEEARKWIRKNIETLARDKNIALTTGEIPPAAKFYLGREELKDGNVLEIEFKTE